MSFKVLIIPEDPVNNGYILRPLTERILVEAGKANAQVRVMENPRARGYEQVVGMLRSGAIFERYSHFELLLFMPDRDGADKSAQLVELERLSHDFGARLICCPAWQEVEAWLLAGHVDKVRIGWGEIRQNASVKEDVFVEFLRRFGDSERAGGGRDYLMQETLENYRGLVSRCPELLELQERIHGLSR